MITAVVVVVATDGTREAVQSGPVRNAAAEV